MNFLNSIGKSIYGPEYYESLHGKPFSYSFVYFLKLALVVSLIVSAVATFYFFRAVNKHLPEFFAGVSDSYPPELVVTLEKGEFRTNVSEPYKIAIPESATSDSEINPQYAEIENFIVFNTNAEADLALYRELKTAVLVGKHDIIFPDDNAIKVQSVAGMPDFVLSKDKIESGISQVQYWLKLVSPLVFFIIFPIIFIFGVSLYMFSALFWALVVWLVAHLRGVKMGYSKAYQLTLHVVTSLVFVKLIKIFVFDPKIPFLSLVIVILVAAVNMAPEKIPVPKY